MSELFTESKLACKRSWVVHTSWKTCSPPNVDATHNTASVCLGMRSGGRRSTMNRRGVPSRQSTVHYESVSSVITRRPALRPFLTSRTEALPPRATHCRSSFPQKNAQPSFNRRTARHYRSLHRVGTVARPEVASPSSDSLYYRGCDTRILSPARHHAPVIEVKAVWNSWRYSLFAKSSWDTAVLDPAIYSVSFAVNYSSCFGSFDLAPKGDVLTALPPYTQMQRELLLSSN